MISIEQAKALRHGDEVHHGACRVHIGPRGGKTWFITRLRVGGKLKLWKGIPENFRLPLKYGLGYSYFLDQNNARNFHIPADCPVKDI